MPDQEIENNEDRTAVADDATDLAEEESAAAINAAEDTVICVQTADAAEESASPATKRKYTIFTKENVVEYTKRTVFLLVGLLIMSFGVAFSIKADLGTSPVSSIPYVLNIITGLSVGITTIIVNTGIVVLQIVLLRRRFHPFQLFQVAVCTVFGFLTDFALFCVDDVAPTEYWQQWLFCLLGIVLVATGVSFEVTANVITLAGEGLTLAMCTLLPRVKFGYMKVMCDCAMVIVAVALAFIFLHELAAVREGTLAAAIFVGLISKQLNKVITPLGNRLFYPHAHAAQKS